jgi:hypothetical protein
LISNRAEIKSFIEKVIQDGSIYPLWRDELIVSVLLSDYSYSFFEFFKDDLLESGFVFLKRIIFIVRISCKELDNSLIEKIKFDHDELLRNKYYFVKPKGAGWRSLIEFIYNNIEKIGMDNISFIVPLLYEWNMSNKQGETTKHSSLVCLNYYKYMESSGKPLHSGKFGEMVVKTALYGSAEITEEFSLIIDEIIRSPNPFQSHPYELLVNTILCKPEANFAVMAFHKRVLSLASHIWLGGGRKKRVSGHRRNKDEDRFGVIDNYDFKYRPASALQSPISLLLRRDFFSALDFIIKFSNSITNNFINSFQANKPSMVIVDINGVNQEVVADTALWLAYRRSSGIPELYSSILMALEKFILESIDLFEGDTLEETLIYILRQSNSSSLYGVVSSIVVAHRDRFFDIAKILFSVKEFILFDSARSHMEYSFRSEHSISSEMFGSLHPNSIYDEERIKSCDSAHRNESLETTALYYQLFSHEGDNQEKIDKRQNYIWALLDGYYEDIESEGESCGNQDWRFCLARMDRRKMDIESKLSDAGVEISMSPTLSPTLQAISNKTIEDHHEKFKYLPLRNWASSKGGRSSGAVSSGGQYDSSPSKAVTELRELYEVFSKDNVDIPYEFSLMNFSSLPIVASVLIKNYRKEFCIDILKEKLLIIFSGKYKYQVGDGFKEIFEVLPDIYGMRENDRDDIKVVLVMALFINDRISMLGGEGFYAFSINAIYSLWGDFKSDVESMLRAYLVLKPIYSNLINLIQEESFAKNKFDVDYSGLWSRFYDENEELINTTLNADNSDNNLDFNNLSPSVKSISLQLIPNNSQGFSRIVLNEIIKSSSELLLSDDGERGFEYEFKSMFFKKYAYLVLNDTKEKIPELLAPFLAHFKASKAMPELLKEFVWAAESLDAYEEFWCVWQLFKPKIVELSKEGFTRHYTDELIKSYLFSVGWNESNKSCRILKNKDKKFFYEMSLSLSGSSAALYAFSRLLNGVGSCYQVDAVYWISNIIDSSVIIEEDLNDITLQHISNFIRQFIFDNRECIRKTPEIMKCTITILELLIEKGEVTGYMLRENIL